MKKIDLGQALGILANLGVLGGLALVGFEIRQNTSATVSTTIHAVPELSVTASLTVAQNSELAFVRSESQSDGGLDQLTETQKTQLASYHVALMRSHRYQFSTGQTGHW